MPLSKVIYDRAFAETYDRRYEVNDYSGVEAALLAFIAQSRQTRALEVGCGTGHWLRLIAGRVAHVAGLDASAAMLKQARGRAPEAALVQARAERLPLTDGSVHRLFCVNVLHHIQDKLAFLTEARRVVRPGGQLMSIGLDPHTGSDGWYIYEYFESARETDRRRYASTGQVRAWLQELGFVDVHTREVQHLSATMPMQTAIAEGRLDRRASSQLAMLSDDEYERGMGKIRSVLALAEARGAPLMLSADLRLYGTYASVPA